MAKRYYQQYSSISRVRGTGMVAHSLKGWRGDSEGHRMAAYGYKVRPEGYRSHPPRLDVERLRAMAEAPSVEFSSSGVVPESPPVVVPEPEFAKRGVGGVPVRRRKVEDFESVPPAPSPFEVNE